MEENDLIRHGFAVPPSPRGKAFGGGLRFMMRQFVYAMFMAAGCHRYGDGDRLCHCCGGNPVTWGKRVCGRRPHPSPAATPSPEGKAFGGDYVLRCADSYTQGLWRQIAAATEAAIVFTAVASFLCFTSSRPRPRAVSHSIPISLSTSSSVVAQLVAMRLITRPSSSFSQKSSSAPSDRRASVSSSSTTKIWFVGVSMAKR